MTRKLSCCGTIVFIVSLGALSYIMNSPLDHNEHMYVAAGKLIQSKRIYTDFAFLQMPYLAVIYGVVFKFVKTGEYLTAARLCSFCFFLFSCLMMYLISKILSRDRFFALTALILFSFNEIIIKTMKESSNYSMAIAASLAALYLFILHFSKGSKNFRDWFFFGFVFTLAVGIKLYYAVSVIPFLLVIIFVSRAIRFKNSLRTIYLPVGLGFFIGLIPLLYFMFRDFNNFMFNNLGYHIINTRYFFDNGIGAGMNFFSKISYFWSILKLESNMILLLLIFGASIFMLLDKTKSRFKCKIQIETSLVVMLSVTSILAIFCMSPLWNQYLTFPIPYIILLCVAMFSSLGRNRKTSAKFFVGIMLLWAIFSGGDELLKYRKKLLKLDKWTVTSIRSNSNLVKNYLLELGIEGKVATLSPIFAIDAGLNVYNEFSTGPFLYRIGHYLSERQLEEYIGVSSKRVGEFLNKVKPQAILVGREPLLDKAFILYAEQNGYSCISQNLQGLSLYYNQTF